jgi:hypothetical protein
LDGINYNQFAVFRVLGGLAEQFFLSIFATFISPNADKSMEIGWIFFLLGMGVEYALDVELLLDDIDLPNELATG